MSNPNNHTIYLAGGCFWGVEEYFSRVPGVLDAVSGYANGRSETTRYELIGQTGHAETVQVTYDFGYDCHDIRDQCSRASLGFCCDG